MFHISKNEVAVVSGYNGDDQPATKAQLSEPSFVVVSSQDNVYISERLNHRIRKIDRNGMISTICGNGEYGYNGDGILATSAKLRTPWALFVTEDEQVLFCDRANHRVRKIDRFGMISTIAGNGVAGYNGDDQLAVNAQLSCPSGVFMYKNEIYIADSDNNRIRKILQNGMITTLASDTPIHSPSSIFLRNDQLFFTQQLSHVIMKLFPNGTVARVAGNGKYGYNGDGIPACSAMISYPSGLFVDGEDQIYMTSSDGRIRKVDRDGLIQTIGGGDVELHEVEFDFGKWPHVGPRKKEMIKRFDKAYYDIVFEILEN